MSTATELLRRALEHLEWCDEDCCNEKLEEQIRTFLAAKPEAEPFADSIPKGVLKWNPEAEPIGFEFTIPSKELVRYHNDEDCIEIKVDLPRYPAGSRFYPPKPAEPEAEPVAWLVSYPNQPELGCWFSSGKVDLDALVSEPLYLHPPKPAEPEADEPTDILTIAYQLGYQEGKKSKPEPAIRKLMTDQEILKGIDADACPYEEVLAFATGVRWAEKHHGIGGDDC
jgi:hypothetical protein